MRSMLTQCLCWLSSVGLLFAGASTATAQNIYGEPCATCVLTVPILSPAVRMESRFSIDSWVVDPGLSPSIPTGQSILVLYCPAEARVTIDGRVTHASGSTRQYNLRYCGDVHTCHIAVRLRDDGEMYEFDVSRDLRNGKQSVLAVARTQMTRTSQRELSDTISTYFKPGTTLTVTTDNKLEIVSDSTDQRAISLSATVPPVVPQQSPLRRTREHQLKLLRQESDVVKTLAKQESEKRTRWEAANRILQLTHDAFQIKSLDVNLAANDSAAIQAAKKLEAMKLELELARAIEVERQAKSEYDDAKKEHADALKQMNGRNREIELTEREIIAEHLKKGIAEEEATLQSLREHVAKKSTDDEVARKLYAKLAAERVAKRDESLEAELQLAQEIARTLQQELKAAQQEFEQANIRVQQKKKELDGFGNKSLHFDLPEVHP